MFLTKMRASAADDRSPYGDFWFTPVAARSATGLRVSPDRAMQLPAVLACVRVLAESFSILPLRVYRNVGSTRQRLTKHWLIDLLARHPNPYQTPFEWREMMQGHLALRGNAYNQIIANRSGNITALMPLHPDRVKIEFIGAGAFNYRYRYTDHDGVERPLARGEVWHLRGLSSDGVMGLSPIALARESAALGLAAQEYGARFFQNDAKPGGGWIEFPGKFKDKPARDTFRESWQEAQSGLNRGKIAILEYGMKFHELGLTNKDSQFLEARQFQVGDVARIFRVPPHLIGDLSKATFSNIEQQSLDFVIHTMTPWAERWESSIETSLLLEDEADIEVEFDFTALLRGDQQARALYYHNGVLDGWMTRNEARDREGMEPLDGLDEPLRPLNMVEESQANDPPPPARQPVPPQGGGTPKSLDEPACDGADASRWPSRPLANERLFSLIAGNAARMARRIAGGNTISAETLAEALAIPVSYAAHWLETRDASTPEPECFNQLLRLGARV